MAIAGFPEVEDADWNADLAQGFEYAEKRHLMRRDQWWRAHSKMFVARFKGNAQSGQPLNQSDLDLILATEETFQGK